MYTLVRRYIKTSLLFFLVGLALGVWIMWKGYWGDPAGMSVVISAHTHVILIGFIITLIMGIAYWMFPRPAREDYRYSPNMAEVNYWLVTGGTVVRLYGEMWQYASDGAHGIIWAAIGAGAQTLAGVVFAWNIWSRVRPIGSDKREAKGERF
ncbi:MAG: cbb3-type cytochrome c oxidase subunit I [Nitrospinae bacterium]|nr:cbb3-type cytochrome c oxidase subunit I [Nitrospinota bacterium]